MTSQPDGPLRRVVLERAHTHAGQACAPGQALDLDAASAEWLLAQGIARPAGQRPYPLAALEAPGPSNPDPQPLLRKEPKQ